MCKIHDCSMAYGGSEHQSREVMTPCTLVIVLVPIKGQVYLVERTLMASYSMQLIYVDFFCSFLCRETIDSKHMSPTAMRFFDFSHSKASA